MSWSLVSAHAKHEPSFPRTRYAHECTPLHEARAHGRRCALDGADGHTRRCPGDPHFEELKAMGAFLSGRVTYELMAGFWPTADADPGSTPFVKEFAPIWRGRGLHGSGPDRRVPDLRPPDPDRGGEAPFSPFEGEGPAPPRRDPNFRERGRPSPVRTTPAPWGELVPGKAVGPDPEARLMLVGPRLLWVACESAC